jgi:hypothetical protein
MIAFLLQTGMSTPIELSPWALPSQGQSHVGPRLIYIHHVPATADLSHNALQTRIISLSLGLPTVCEKCE